MNTKFLTTLLGISLVILISASLIISRQNPPSTPSSSRISQQNSDPNINPSATSPSQNQKPSFTLASLDGTTITPEDFAGKPTLIKLGTTYCHICMQEVPEMKQAYSQLSNDANIIFVLLGASPAQAQAYINKYNLPYPVYLDPTGSAGKTFNVLGTPTHAILDKDGQLAKRSVGFLSSSQIISELTKLL